MKVSEKKLQLQEEIIAARLAKLEKFKTDYDRELLKILFRATDNSIRIYSDPDFLQIEVISTFLLPRSSEDMSTEFLEVYMESFEDINREFDRYIENRKEQERKYEVKKKALSKLTTEEKELLEL